MLSTSEVSHSVSNTFLDPDNVEFISLLDTALLSYGLCYAFCGHFGFGNLLMCPIYILRCLILSPMDSLTLKMWNSTPILPILDTALQSYSRLAMYSMHFGGHFVFGHFCAFPVIYSLPDGTAHSVHHI
jgi:hypothetical protein